MSLIKKMNISVKVERNTVTKDEYENSITTLSVVYENIKCFIHSFEYSYGLVKSTTYGLDMRGKYQAYFKPGVDIKEGDKITCNNFSPSEFFVDSSNPVHRPNNQVHHIEVMLSTSTT